MVNNHKKIFKNIINKIKIITEFLIIINKLLDFREIIVYLKSSYFSYYLGLIKHNNGIYISSSKNLGSDLAYNF